MSGERPNQVLRSIAEQELANQYCKPCEVKQDVPGQWWLAPGGGPKFFLQWCKDAPSHVDEQHLRCILEDLARYRPLGSPH